MSWAKKQGVLLVNLGTPDDPSVPAVRRYLKEFLSDARVITLPSVLRYLLLYGFILPFRPKQSAEAYQKIWSGSGSPLLVNSLSLVEKLANNLESSYYIELGMRYGQPSLQTAIDNLLDMDCQRIIVLPLFPQYASATTGSVIEEIFRILKKKLVIPHLDVISDFFDNSSYIEVQAKLISQFWQQCQADFLLFSNHGLPQSHINAVCKQQDTYYCDKKQCIQDTRYCYKRQCIMTADLIAKALGVPAEKYSVAFQSRLGRTPWIRPYTDEVLPELYEQGVRRLLVSCPSFVADCLETLEEIGIRAKEQWLSLGGESLTLVPCLNDDDDWVMGVAQMIQNAAQGDDPLAA